MAEYTAAEVKDKSSTELKQGKAQSRYMSMETTRRPFLERARTCSELTLPYLIPPEGWTGQSELYTPFQGIGSRGVKNLSSKLMIVLFPPNSPFARLRMQGKAEDQAKQADPALTTKIEAQLADIERKIGVKVETEQMRPHLDESLKHLIVGGNVLLHLPEKEKGQDVAGVRVFHLNRYVCKRDPSGNLLEMITKESVSPESLDSKFYAALNEKAGEEGKHEKTLDIYTRVWLEEGTWYICQEVQGYVVPGTEGTYPEDKLPWICLRWNKIDGEDYGRGYVEDLLGDLQSAEGLSQTVIEGSAALAKLLFLTNPNGVTKAADLEKTKNGGFVAGNAADITTLQSQKAQDLSVAKDTLANVEKRLSQQFMLNSSAQRQGERVTAEEMRIMIREIEESLGGIYSVLAHGLQLPLVKLFMWRMEKAKEIPTLPKGTVRPIIVTGLEALGRGNDLQKLREYVGDAIQTLTPQVAVKYLNVSDYLSRLATGAGIDPTGLVKTAEELKAQAEQEAQAAQTQQIMDMVQKLGPAAIKGGIDMKGMQNGAGTESLPGAPQAGSGSGNSPVPSAG
jgi:hypothetical protein